MQLKDIKDKIRSLVTHPRTHTDNHTHTSKYMATLVEGNCYYTGVYGRALLQSEDSST